VATTNDDDVKFLGIQHGVSWVGAWVERNRAVYPSVGRKGLGGVALNLGVDRCHNAAATMPRSPRF
jgi:hypothetical protein